MHLKVERRSGRPPSAVHVFEVITPRTNEASLTSAENLLASVSLHEPFALEVSANHQARRFLVRTPSDTMRQHLSGQLGAAYPQAALRAVASDADPARVSTGEQVATSVPTLRGPAYLPLRTFTEAEVDPQRASQADPVLGVLSALGGLPPGWRALSQLVLAPVPDTWGRDYERLAVQHPLTSERIPRAGDSSLPIVMLIAVVLGLGALGLQAYDWYGRGQWLGVLAAVAARVGLLLGFVGVRRWLRAPLYDMELVREKVSRVAFRCELRLSVIAPPEVDVGLVRARLQRFAAAYRHFNLAAGNGFRVHTLSVRARELGSPRPVAGRRHRSILTTRELAGLWHLPHALADVAGLERTTARTCLPLPGVVDGPWHIGVSKHQDQRVPVGLSDDLLSRHLLLVAKTRRGKSTLMQRLAQFAMQTRPRRAVVLVDPHQDLAEVTLAHVPRDRSGDVLYLDLANAERPIGLNLLDAGLGWSRDRAVANALTVFQREWGDRYWGPRMEDIFRFGLLTLYTANAARCASDGSAGRAAQHTLLDLSTLLRDDAFRRSVLAHVADPTIHKWWATYFDPLERRSQSEYINPVLTKLHRFEGNSTARLIVGQPVSSINPLTWLRDRALVVVNTARGTLGENASALLGSTLVNLVALAIAEQARIAASDRARITIFVDEFHTLPGVDYEGILAELSKYGANLVLATQSLARLAQADGERGLGLRAMVFANLDGLFAFNCSAEDADYLVPELGGALDVQDLVELGEHQCYVRMSWRGKRVPAYSVSLAAPTPGDVELRAMLAAESAARYGRPAEEVEAALNRAIVHGATVSAAVVVETPSERPRRNEHRGRKKRRAAADEIQDTVTRGSERDVVHA